MSTRIVPLYVSATGWVAPGRVASEPLSGRFDDAHTADWSEPAKVLREQFGSAHVQAMLSARLCRFLSLPWLSSCFTGPAIRNYVFEAFLEAASVSPQTHCIEIDWPRYGDPILAVAYPRDAIEALRIALAGARLHLAGVDSTVTAVVRRHGRHLGAGQSLLAYAEDDGITAVTIEAGSVVQVETLSGQCGGLDDMSVWSARKRFAFADDAQLRWLASTPQPEGFVGVDLPVAGAPPRSPGHALVEACR